MQEVWPRSRLSCLIPALHVQSRATLCHSNVASASLYCKRHDFYSSAVAFRVPNEYCTHTRY